MNIPDEVYSQSVPNVPLRVKQTPEGYEVTSTHFPGKVWTGKDEQTAIRAQQVEVKEMYGKREAHLAMHKSKWMVEEETKKATPGLRVPEKSLQGK